MKGCLRSSAVAQTRNQKGLEKNRDPVERLDSVNFCGRLGTIGVPCR